MTFRDDIQPCIDAARGLVDDLDLRPHDVIIRTRTWSGAERGQGTETDVDVTIDPRPKVSYPNAHLVAAAPGKYAEGDRLISKVTRALTEADLTDHASELGASVERFIRINGDDYRHVSEPELRNFEWRLHVRRMRQR